jgi:hypothetical protein
MIDGEVETLTSHCSTDEDPVTQNRSFVTVNAQMGAVGEPRNGARMGIPATSASKSALAL